jgi:hypothetical protein
MIKRLFGTPKHALVCSPTNKLAEASSAIEQRIAEVERRTKTAKQEALAAHKRGDKTAALRLMTRAKGCEKQVTALWHASSALERQSEMLEEASLQKQVADALSTSVKKMKGSKRLLEGVDKLSDEAAEMRDISEDVQHALQSIAESTNDPSLDDDELMQELEAMSQSTDMETTAAAPESASCTNVMSHASEQELAQFPSAPQHRQESNALLAFDMSQ